jgi:hypothetical protein
MKALRGLAVASALSVPMPAMAQGIPVYDSSTFLQTLSTVKNTLSMIEQGKEQISQATDLFNSVNKLTGGHWAQTSSAAIERVATAATALAVSNTTRQGQ